MNTIAKNNYFSAMDRLASHIAVIDAGGAIIYTNKRWDEFAHANESKVSDWIGVNYLDICEQADQDANCNCQSIINGLRRILTADIDYFEEVYPCHSDDELRSFVMRATCIEHLDKPAICVSHDIFPGHSDLVVSEKRLKLATDSAQIGIWEWSLDEQRLVWNRWMHKIYGISNSDFDGQYTSWERGVHPEDLPKAQRQLKEAVNTSAALDTDFRVIQPNGEIRYVMARAQVIKDEMGRVTKMIGVNVDITDQKIAEEKIRSLAFYDQLTGLANRSLFQDRISQAMLSSHQTQEYGALLFIDVDNFKVINDSQGHAIGDELLIEIGKRLLNTIQYEDSVARIGGDEFTILISNLDSDQQQAANMATNIAQQVLKNLSQPFRLESVTFNTSVSIGITLFKGHKSSPGVIMRQADLAMYKAKGCGRNTVHFYDPSMQKEVSDRVQLESDLNAAIQREEFVLNFQPQFDQNGRITGAEALIRWQHPRDGLLTPFAFISVAESCGKIVEIGNWVIDKALSTLSYWTDEYIDKQFTLAINISAQQIEQPDFVERLLGRIAHYNIQHKQIKLELTESMLLSNIEATIEKMAQLKSKGVMFSLDDFGTGYSSLSYLKKLPLDQLKIDRSFVQNILTDQNDIAIAKTIIALANILELDVIAEGVETEQQLELLKQIGCGMFQGFLFSKPIPEHEFIALIKTLNA